MIVGIYIVISRGESMAQKLIGSTATVVSETASLIGTPTTPEDPGRYTSNPDILFIWTPGTVVNPESEIVGYYLQVSTTVGRALNIADVFEGDIGNILRCSGSGCSHGITYYARVRAKNKAGLYGKYSEWSDGVTVDLIPPGRPGTITVISKGKGVFDFSWLPPKDDDVTGYYYKLDLSPLIKFHPTTSIKGVTVSSPGTHTFYVKSRDHAEGISDYISCQFVSNYPSSISSWGTRSLSTPTIYSTGEWPTEVSIGDINSDGKNEVCVANFNSNSFSIFTQTKNGTLNNQISNPVGEKPVGIAIGDITGDGKDDIVIGNASGDTISLYIQGEDNTLTYNTMFLTGSWPYGIAIGDVNDDGRNDVCVANLGSNNISVYLQNSQGRLNSQILYPSGQYPYGIACGDINGDGKIDICAANYKENTLSIYLQDNNGELIPLKGTYTTGGSPTRVTIGDLNSDGRADIAVSGIGSMDIMIYYQSKDGKLIQKKVTTKICGRHWGVAMADLNCDGRSDLIVTNEPPGISVFLQQEDGTLTDEFYYPGGGTGGLSVGDINNDGYQEVVAPYAGGGCIGVFTVQP